MKLKSIDINATIQDIAMDTEFYQTFCEFEPKICLEQRPIAEQQQIKSVTDAINYVDSIITKYPQEHVYAIFLDAALYPLGISCVGIGNTKSSMVSFAKIVQIALLLQASNIVLVHNHPSQAKPRPSQADITTARQLALVLSMIDNMSLCDFIIISNNPAQHFYSMHYDTYMEHNPCAIKPVSEHIADIIQTCTQTTTTAA